MRTMVRLLAVAILVAISFNVTNAEEPTTSVKPLLTTEELTEGWVTLFDGKTFFGWRPNTDGRHVRIAASKHDLWQPAWHAGNGILTSSLDDPTMLCTTSQWGNFRLKLDFKTVDRGKAAVLLRTAPTLFAKSDRQAYRINITGPNTNSDYPTGSLVERQKTKPIVKPSTDWQTMDVTANGPKIVVRIDGKKVVDYTDPKSLGRGFIGLELDMGKIQFRNIKLRPLGEKSLFNGKDLNAWNTYPDMKSVFSVTEKGEINVKNGKGQLETKEAFDDFTLQLEVFVAGEKLNSGIFFRCIPGETMNGYESQIQNGFLDGDRNKPADCGTGGIFRRQNARRVVADDFTWFFKTIHADDNHVAVWVNGYQVTDWVDRRKPNKNPRRGLRLEPGTIMIQGHDPTTDISFRNLRISKLPERSLKFEVRRVKSEE